jgi:two-component system response regulator DevR
MPWAAVLVRSNKEIAGELFIAEKTMNAPISNILAKLGLEDRTQPAAFAVKHGCE